MNFKVKFLGFLIIAGIAIQFIPYGKNHSNPPIAGEPQWDSPRTKELFLRVCANCHSNTTTWPWYSNIAPVSWLIQFDVDGGRKRFNVSMWNVQKKNKGYDAAEEVREDEMPPLQYKIGHPEAKLTESERIEFIKGLTATFGNAKEK